MKSDCLGINKNRKGSSEVFGNRLAKARTRCFTKALPTPQRLAPEGLI
jgi:hypothetical protein